jgi:hypothetical protein
MGPRLTPVPPSAYMPEAKLAGWQSGYAEDCKSSYSGSIPLPASSEGAGASGRP